MDQNEGAEPSDFGAELLGVVLVHREGGEVMTVVHLLQFCIRQQEIWRSASFPPVSLGCMGESSSEEVPTTKDHFFRRGIDPDLHGGSWEINVARENMDSLPHTPRKGRGEQPSSGGNSPGRQPVAIELKETDSNPMLGQFHMENQGQFLKDKWALARKPERKGSSEAHSRREEDLAPILDLEDHVADFGDPILDDLT